MEFSKTYQYRKVMKPLLERQRRARINKCLDQLKDLMIDCLKKDNEHIVRLEKADILEYTVEYLRKTKSHEEKLIQLQMINKPNDNLIEMKSFRNGYVHAANEVSKVMAATRGIDISLGTHLMTHLGHKLNHLQQNNIPETVATPTSTVIHKQFKQPQKLSDLFYSPLNIETLDNNDDESPNKLLAISPVSSGYHSDTYRCYSMASPVSSEESFAMHSTSTQSNEIVWRPW